MIEVEALKIECQERAFDKEIDAQENRSDKTGSVRQKLLVVLL